MSYIAFLIVHFSAHLHFVRSYQTGDNLSAKIYNSQVSLIPSATSTSNSQLLQQSIVFQLYTYICMWIVEFIFSLNTKTTTKRRKLLIADCIISMEVRRMRPKPKMNPLDKRIKPNPKYSKVISFDF